MVRIFRSLYKTHAEVESPFKLPPAKYTLLAVYPLNFSYNLIYGIITL